MRVIECNHNKLHADWGSYHSAISLQMENITNDATLRRYPICVNALAYSEPRTPLLPEIISIHERSFKVYCDGLCETVV